MKALKLSLLAGICAATLKVMAADAPKETAKPAKAAPTGSP